MASDSEERREVEEVMQVRRPREGDEVQQGGPEDFSRPFKKDQSPAVPLSWVQIKFLSFLLSFSVCDCVMAKRPVKAAAKARAVVNRLKSKLSKAQKKASKLSAACARGKTKKSRKSRKYRKSRKTRRH